MKKRSQSIRESLSTRLFKKLLWVKIYGPQKKKRSLNSIWKKKKHPLVTYKNTNFDPYPYHKPQLLDGYGSIPINTIFMGMNIHLPAILMFTRGTRFWHTARSEPMEMGHPRRNCCTELHHRLPRHPYRCSSPAGRRRRNVPKPSGRPSKLTKKKMEKIWLTKVWYPTWPIPNQKSLPIPIPIKTKIALWFFGVWEEDTPAVRPETESAQHEHVNLEQRPKQITVMDLYCTSNA